MKLILCRIYASTGWLTHPSCRCPSWGAVSRRSVRKIMQACTHTCMRSLPLARLILRPND
eukprot:13569561-Alexandrium_andersonii.AAC.1